jgi:hypothetical protein
LITDDWRSKSYLCELELISDQLPLSKDTYAVTSPCIEGLNLNELKGISISNSGEINDDNELPEIEFVVELQVELSRIHPESSGLELKESWILPPPEIPYKRGESPDSLDVN